MEFRDAGKGGKSAARGIQLEYSSDRLSEKKIIQVYQLLIPGKGWATSGSANSGKEPVQQRGQPLK